MRRIPQDGARSCRLQPKINHHIYKILLSVGISSVIRSIYLIKYISRIECWKPHPTGRLIVQRDDEYLGRWHPDVPAFGSYRWADAGDAADELVELGSAFLCADLGVTPEPRDDHSSYLASWLDVLKSDNRTIFTAAAHAHRRRRSSAWLAARAGRDRRRRIGVEG
jgi:Zincin-like metallopeptidase